MKYLAFGLSQLLADKFVIMCELSEYLISDIRRVVIRLNAFGHRISVWTLNVELVLGVNILVKIGKLRRLLMF